MGELNPTHVAITVITVAVALVALAAVALPILDDVADKKYLDLAAYKSGIINGQTGTVWEYDYSTTTECDIVLSGSAADYADVRGGAIYVSFPESGSYTLGITAVSHQPEQTAYQSYDFIVEVSDPAGAMDATPILLVIPMILLVALIVYQVRRSRTVG